MFEAAVRVLQLRRKTEPGRAGANAWKTDTAAGFGHGAARRHCRAKRTTVGTPSNYSGADDQLRKEPNQPGKTSSNAADWELCRTAVASGKTLTRFIHGATNRRVQTSRGVRERGRRKGRVAYRSLRAFDASVSGTVSALRWRSRPQRGVFTVKLRAVSIPVAWRLGHHGVNRVSHAWCVWATPLTQHHIPPWPPPPWPRWPVSHPKDWGVPGPPPRRQTRPPGSPPGEGRGRRRQSAGVVASIPACR